MPVRKEQHASFWIGSRTSALETLGRKELLVKLNSIRRGISNFVRILTGKDIPIRFSSGEQSYTNGRSVIVLSATNDPTKLDAQVGVALHEASHILLSQNIIDWTNMALFPDYFSKTDFEKDFIFSRLITDSLLMRAREFRPGSNLVQGATRYELGKQLQWLMNFLEDRRIDEHIYRDVPGYRPYIEAHYVENFYSDRIDAMLQKDLPLTLQSYNIHILSMFNPYARPDALPGLQDIWNIVDLPNISRYTTDPYFSNIDKHRSDICERLKRGEMPMMVSDARDILEIIYQHALPDAKDPENNKLGPPEDDQDDQEEDELDNLDMNTGAPDSTESQSKDSLWGDGDEKGEGEGEGEGEDGPPSPEDMKAIRKALRKMNRAVNGHLEHSNDAKLNDHDQVAMEQINQSDATLVGAGASVFGNDITAPVIIYRKLTKQLMEQSDTIFARMGFKDRDSVEGIALGTNMGMSLVHRLQILGDESTMKVTRQKNGRLDKRLIHELPYGTGQVFAQETIAHLRPVFVDLCLDASGSMNGEKWVDAMTMAAALAYASSKLEKLDVRISIRTSARNRAEVVIIYDSREDTYVKVTSLWPYLTPNGGTPEGLCFEALMKDVLSTSPGVRRFFVNLSDGEPAFSFYDENGKSHSYYNDSAARHTSAMVRKMRQENINVLSYFIGNTEEHESSSELFRTMYGPDAAFINVKSVTQVVSTFNKLFLKGN